MADFLDDLRMSFINDTHQELDSEFMEEDAWLEEALEDNKMIINYNTMHLLI